MTDARGDRPDGTLSARSMAAVVVSATLIAGILVGIGLDRAFFRPPRRPAFGAFVTRHGPNADSARQVMRATLGRQLGLTPDQEARIDTIMQRRMAALDSIRKATGLEIRALIGATRAQIDTVLTPEQRDKFHALQQHRRNHRFPGAAGGVRAP